MRTVIALVLGLTLASGALASSSLVMMTDFGVQDGAVAEMKGVVAQVDPGIRVTDLTHQIPPFDIWQGAFQLDQTMKYWPAGTVFVCVVDPGVGGERTSVVAHLKDPGSGRDYVVVTPNNGTLTFVLDHSELLDVHEIDETRNRLPTGSQFHTFHGRDLFAYTGARLAAGQVTRDAVGPRRERKDLVHLGYREPTVAANGEIVGLVPSLDSNYGNVWTNIPQTLLARAGIKPGMKLSVRIFDEEASTTRPIWQGVVGLEKTFAAVPEGRPLAYVNSLDCLAFALNMGSFAKAHGIRSGPRWVVRVGPKAP